MAPLDLGLRVQFSRAMQFAGPAENYDRFMGRYTPTLAVGLADAAAVTAGMRVLDVGCGPGGLARELVARVGEAHVAAIDPAQQFAAACQARSPGADVRVGVAEALPWTDGTFEAALSSLVIGFMSDPDQGVREMARVTRPGGTVAVCMWDLAGGGMTMLRYFWDAARAVDPRAQGEHRMAGAQAGDIARRLTRASLEDVTDGALTASAQYADFDDFWEPLTLAVGPAGQHLQSLTGDQQIRVREALRSMVPEGAFTLEARAWCARGTVGE